MKLFHFFLLFIYNRQETLLTSISEKDANIATLEEEQDEDDGNETNRSSSVDSFHSARHHQQKHSNKNQLEIDRLYEEKDKLHQQLKELVS